MSHLEFCEIHWVSGSIDEARKICRYLVQERLAASAQIIPWIEAIYRLNNQLETTQQSKAILITLKSHYKQIEEVIKNNSSFEIPEILMVCLEEGNKDYLDWAKQNATLN